MSTTQMNAVPRWQQICLWSAKALVAAAFLAAGGAKLFGATVAM